jgi:hypothetical protein
MTSKLGSPPIVAEPLFVTLRYVQNASASDVDAFDALKISRGRLCTNYEPAQSKSYVRCADGCARRRWPPRSRC